MREVIRSTVKEMYGRAEIAADLFKSNLVEQFGLSDQQAEHVLCVFIRAKAIKLNWSMARYDLRHGAYWERAAIDAALSMEV